MNLQKPFGLSRDELGSIEIEPFSNQLKPFIEEALKETKRSLSKRYSFYTNFYCVLRIRASYAS